MKNDAQNMLKIVKENKMTEYSIEEIIFRKPYISGEKIITWKLNQIIDEHNTFEDIESDFRNQIKSGYLHNLHNLRGKWVLARLHFYNKNESLKKTIRICEYYEKKSKSQRIYELENAVKMLNEAIEKIEPEKWKINQ